MHKRTIGEICECSDSDNDKNDNNDNNDKNDKNDDKPDKSYLLLIHGIARAAANQSPNFDIENASTAPILGPLVAYDLLWNYSTLIETMANISWTPFRKAQGNEELIRKMEVDAAILTQYYKLLFAVNKISSQINECTRQIKGKPEERKMGEIDYIKDVRKHLHKAYSKAYNLRFKVFVRNNPRISLLQITP